MTLFTGGQDKYKFCFTRTLYKVNLTNRSKSVHFLSKLYLCLLTCHSLIFFLASSGTVHFKKDISCSCYFSICVAFLHLKIKAKAYEYVSQVIQMLLLVWCNMTEICVIIRACLKLFILGETYLRREFPCIYRESMDLSCNWRE